MNLPFRRAPVDRSFTLSRTFKATPPEVFDFWTDPAFVREWWGIKNAEIVTCEIDLRVGGTWLIDMKTPSGRVYRNRGEYLEIVANERLVFTDVPDLELPEWQGRRSQPGINRVHFDADGDNTIVTIEVELASTAERDLMLALGVQEGMNQGFDRLEQLIAKRR